MHKPRTHEPPPEVLALGHQPEGRHPLLFWGGVLSVFLLTVIATATSYWAIQGFRQPEQTVDKPEVERPNRVVGDSPFPDLFPAPAVEPNQRLERERLTRKAREELFAYRWIDRSAGRAIVPISRAVELMTARQLAGLPPAEPDRDKDSGERSAASSPPAGDRSSSDRKPTPLIAPKPEGEPQAMERRRPHGSHWGWA